MVLEEQKNYAETGYEDIYDVVRKLDEVRFAMNKQMGPGGPMAPENRKKFLHHSLPDHD